MAEASVQDAAPPHVNAKRNRMPADTPLYACRDELIDDPSR